MAEAATAVAREAVEVATKANVFLDKIQKVVPGIGDVCGWSAETIKEMHKPDMSGGSNAADNLSKTYQQVQAVAPAMAQSAFAEATAFVEYIGKEAPKVFDSCVAGGTNLFQQAQSEAPAAFKAAQSVGGAMFDFVSKQTVPFDLDMIKGAGGALGFMQEQCPDILQAAIENPVGDFVGSGVGQLFNENTGGQVAGGAKQGVSATSQAAKEIGSGMSIPKTGVKEIDGAVGVVSGAAMHGAKEVQSAGGAAYDAVRGVQVDGSVEQAKSGAAVAVKAVSEVDSQDVRSAAGAVSAAAPGAAKAVGSAAGKAFEVVKNSGVTKVAGVAAAAVGSVAGTVGAAIAGTDMGAVSSVLLSAIGTASAAMPFLLPLQIAMKDIGIAVENASYNRESAEILKQRCENCSQTVLELAPKIAKLIKRDGSKAENILDGVVDAIKQCTDFLEKFCKKGFLRCMIGWKKDGFTLKIVDKKVTDAIQDVSMRINGFQIDLQLADSEKMDKLFVMMAAGGGTSGAPMDPQVLADIAAQAGARTSSELTGELQGAGVKMDDIKRVADATLDKVNKMDAKLDTMDVRAEERMKAQMEQIAQLQSIMLMAQMEIKVANQKNLDAIKSATVGSAGGAARVANQEVFSTSMQAQALALKAQARHKVAKKVIIHPNGINMGSFVALDGQNGVNGSNGPLFNVAAAPGRNGDWTRADGGDGADGEDGTDGTDAYDGEDASTPDDFEVTLEFVSEDKEKNSRVYRVEHAGRHGKEEHMIALNLSTDFIYLDGRGGRGGNGGNGGNGGHGQNGGQGGAGGMQSNADGGDGGMGGNGGNGGDGGRGGVGGVGADGCRIRIHTNDPEVLTLVEVDVSGGEGGVAGNNGDPGQGGQPGVGGPGAPPQTAVQYQQVGAQMIPQQVTYRGGKQGKNGKKGKNGRKPQNATKSGVTARSGKFGTVCFLIYDDNGLSESAGTDYRPAITKKELQKLHPQSQIFGKTYNHNVESNFVYGQRLVFGPVLPVNVGALTCPPSTLTGTLTLQAGKVHAQNTAMVAYPTIPPERGTRFGELPANCKQILRVDIPSLSATGFVNEDAKWPWTRQPKSQSKIEGVFRYHFSVGRCEVFSNAEDGNPHESCWSYPVTVDVPVEIPSSMGSTAIRAPESLSLTNGAISFGAMFQLANKLKKVTLIPPYGRFALNVVSQGFDVQITAAAGAPFAKDAKVSDVKEVGPGLRNRSIMCDLPHLEGGQIMDAVFDLKIDVVTPPPPGARIFLRGEVYYDGILATCTAPFISHVAAPWPPPMPALNQSRKSLLGSAPTAGVGHDEVLFVVDSSLEMADYQAVTHLCELLCMRPLFLDIEHYSVMMQGRLILADKLWEGVRGKCPLVWLPSSDKVSRHFEHPSIWKHIEAGGGLVFGAAAAYGAYVLPLAPQATPQDLNYRHVVQAAPDCSLSALKSTLPPDSKNIVGKPATMLAMNIIMAMSTPKKFEFLVEHADKIDGVTTDQLTLMSHTAYVEAGCCSFLKKESKVLPSGPTPVTLRDMVRIALRNDLAIDVHQYSKSYQPNTLAAYNYLDPLLAGIHRITTDAAHAAAMRDTAAAVDAAGFTNKTKFPNMPKGLAVFMKHAADVAGFFNFPDTLGMSERIANVEVSPGLPFNFRQNIREKVNMSWGSALQMRF